MEAEKFSLLPLPNKTAANGNLPCRSVSTFILAAVVGDQPYLNSARTLTDSRVLLIPAQRVRDVFDRDVAFARIVARELARAYRLSVKKLKGYMARSSVERLANWILVEAHQASAQGNIVIPFDRGTLASHIGTTRENLSRSLAQLTDHGVRIRGREIVIDRMEQLEAFARPQRFIDDPTFKEARRQATLRCTSIGT